MSYADEVNTIFDTAKKLIEYIGMIDDNYEIKFNLSNNSSRVYDIRDLLKTEIPDNILTIYIRKSRVNKIPVRFVLKDEEVEIFKKFIEDNTVKKFVPEANKLAENQSPFMVRIYDDGPSAVKVGIGNVSPETFTKNEEYSSAFQKEQHRILKNTSDKDTESVRKQLDDSTKFYETFYPEMIVPEYIIFRVDLPNNFAPFDGEQMKVYGPYIYGGEAIVNKFYELEQTCRESLIANGAEETDIEVERTENSSTIHNGDTYFYLYKTKSSK